MIHQFFDSFRVIGRTNRIKSIKLLIILVFVVCLELLSIGLIVPILSGLFNIEQNLKNFEIIFYFTRYFPQDFNQVIAFSLFFLIVIIIKIILLLYFDYKTQKYCRDINVDICLKAYSYFLYAPWEEVLSKDHGYIIRNILSDTARFVGQGILQFIYIIKNTFFLIFILGYLFFIDFKITFAIFFVFLIFTIIFLFLLKKKLINLSSQSAELDEYRFKNISETILGLRDIKLVGNANYFLDLFKRNEEKATKIVIITTILSKIPRYFLELMLVLTGVILLTFLEIKNFNVVDLVPILGLYGFAILRMIPTFVNYNVNIQAIKYSKFQIDEVIKNATRFSKFYNKGILKNNNKNFQKKINFDGAADIKISNVTFSYNKQNYIFKDLNLQISKDKTICIEGENGSGKSTLVDLISGMLDPVEGKIEFNNQNIQNFKDDWQRNIGYVSQTYYLINSSIKENIIFGRENITDEKIKTILEKVELGKFINSLPEGIETNVGNLGGKLSGGQKQRIVIARTLINDPNIIILDEATSAIDNETEENLLKILNNIKKGKIIIFIAHSENIKKFCDINLLIKNNNIKKLENNN